MLQHINCLKIRASTPGQPRRRSSARQSRNQCSVCQSLVSPVLKGMVSHNQSKLWHKYNEPGIAWWDQARWSQSVGGSWPRWTSRWRRCPWPSEGPSVTAASLWYPPRTPGPVRWCRRGRSCGAGSSGPAPSPPPWGWPSAGPSQFQTSPQVSSGCWLPPPCDKKVWIAFKFERRTHLMAKTWSMSQVIQSELSFSSKKSTPSCPANSGMYSIIARRTWK